MSEKRALINMICCFVISERREVLIVRVDVAVRPEGSAF